MLNRGRIAGAVSNDGSDNLIDDSRRIDEWPDQPAYGYALGFVPALPGHDQGNLQVPARNFYLANIFDVNLLNAYGVGEGRWRGKAHGNPPRDDLTVALEEDYKLRFLVKPASNCRDGYAVNHGNSGSVHSRARIGRSLQTIQSVSNEPTVAHLNTATVGAPVFAAKGLSGEALEICNQYLRGNTCTDIRRSARSAHEKSNDTIRQAPTELSLGPFLGTLRKSSGRSSQRLKSQNSRTQTHGQPNAGSQARLSRRHALWLRCSLVFSLLALSSLPAEARNKHHDANGNPITVTDARPARWCGWWLRQQLGVADRAFNRAIAWKHYGSPASSDCVNCIAVFPHHVGLVTGRPGPGRIILKSGNDGGAVRERERSSRCVIAYRYQNWTITSGSLSTATTGDRFTEGVTR